MKHFTFLLSLVLFAAVVCNVSAAENYSLAWKSRQSTFTAAADGTLSIKAQNKNGEIYSSLRTKKALYFTVTAEIRGEGRVAAYFTGSSGRRYGQSMRLNSQWQKIELTYGAKAGAVTLCFRNVDKSPAAFELRNVKLTAREKTLSAKDIPGKALPVLEYAGINSRQTKEAVYGKRWIHLLSLPVPANSKALYYYVNIKSTKGVIKNLYIHDRGQRLGKPVSCNDSLDKYAWVRLGPVDAAIAPQNLSVGFSGDKKIVAYIKGAVLSTDSKLDAAALDKIYSAGSQPLTGDKSLLAVGRGTPTVDGKLNDAAWQNSIAATPFVVQKVNDFAKQQTELKMLYDDENLYISFLCRADVLDPVNNKLNALQRNCKGRDPKNISRDDRVVILLEDPAAPRIFELAVSASGAIADCTMPKSSDMWLRKDFSWNSDAQVSVNVNMEKSNGFWSVEMAVPWKNLTGKPALNTRWQMIAARYEKDSKENSSFQPVVNGIHAKKFFGTLKFIEKVPGVTVAAMPAFAPGANTLEVDLHTSFNAEAAAALTLGKKSESFRSKLASGKNNCSFPINGSGNLTFSWSVNGSDDLFEYFRSPDYHLAMRSIALEGSVKNGKLTVNGAPFSQSALLRDGKNELKLHSAGDAGVNLACGKWALPFPENWKKDANGNYSVTLFSEATDIWPNWHARGLTVNQGGVQQLYLAPGGFPGATLKDYTLYLDLPEGIKLISATGYYSNYKNHTLSGPVTVRHNDTDFKRYSIKFNQNIKYRSSKKLPGHLWFACTLAIDRNMPKKDTIIAYSAGSAEKNIIEIPRTFTVSVIDPVNGRQPEKYRVAFSTGWLGRSLDKSAFKRLADFVVAAGVTDTRNELGAFNKAINSRHGCHFKNWNFNCQPYIKQHPGTNQINSAGKKHTEYVCTSEMLTPRFAEYINSNIAQWHKHFNSPKHIEWDFESPVMTGALSCFCPRCLKEFAQEAKLDKVPANSNEIKEKYPIQWRDFMNKRFARAAEMLSNAVHKNLKGVMFNVYSGYQSENTKSHYGVDWRLLDGKIDYAMVGYGRNASDLRATQEALPNTKMVIGELIVPYRYSERFAPTFASPANLMRRACDANGGILVYTFPSCDGRTFYSLGEVTRNIAANEEFFLSGQRFTNMLKVRAFEESEYEVLGNGKGDYLIVILNQSPGTRRYNAEFALKAGKKLVELASGKTVDAKFSGSIAPGQFVLYKTK